MSDPGSRPPPRGRALIIEDSAILALNAEDMLRSIGFHPIDVASTVAEALQLSRAHIYSAALIDLMVKDGEALPAALVLAGKHVPIVIASGYADVALPAALAHAPRLQKPYDDETLLAALNEAGGRMKPSL
jgi:CheY-like chemotaxis protein